MGLNGIQQGQFGFSYVEAVVRSMYVCIKERVLSEAEELAATAVLH